MTLGVVLLPLLGSLMAGLLGKKIGCVASHRIAISCVFVSFVLSLLIAKWIFIDHVTPLDVVIYHWGQVGGFEFNTGFLIDPLSAFMMVIVTFVSLLVHIYS